MERSIWFVLPPKDDIGISERFMRDMSRLQWFAVGHGYSQKEDAWTGTFLPEEYTSVLRYLEKFGWEKSATN
jgi:hypothetical protein